MPTFDEYYNELIAGATDITEEERNQLRTLLGKPSLSAKIGNYEPRSVIDQRVEQGTRTFEQQFVAANQPVVDEANAIIEKYKAGALVPVAQHQQQQPPPQHQPPRQPEVPHVDENALLQKLSQVIDQKLGEHSNSTVGIMKHTWAMHTNYASLFPGEPIPVSLFGDVEKLAVERGIALDNAFQIHIAPKLQEKQAKEFEVRLAAAKEEGAREALTRMQSTYSSYGDEGGGVHVITNEVTPINSQRANVPEGFRKMSEEARKEIAYKAFEEDWRKSNNWTNAQGLTN